jgi:hypothetical protein
LDLQDALSDERTANFTRYPLCQTDTLTFDAHPVLLLLLLLLLLRRKS